MRQIVLPKSIEDDIKSRFDKYDILDIFLISGIIIFFGGILFQEFLPHKTSGSIATAIIRDSKTGNEKKYEIARFLNNSNDYSRFETTDGRIVEVYESQVREN